MSFCTACGTKNPVDARFCSACGHALVSPPETTTAEPVQPVEPAISARSASTGSHGTPSVTAAPARVKAFDNPDELWKMYFYVNFFNIGAYFFTSSAAEFLKESGGFLTLPMAIFTVFMVVFLGVSYWLIKKQAVDKKRTLWLLPLIAWHVYAYLEGLSAFDPMYAESSFDFYDAYISGVPETLILIRLFVALRERVGA